MEPAHSTEPSAASAGEIPSATSFSWNSVFDKAWKFTAGTMAPSPTVPSETALEATDEPQAMETQAVESSVVEPPTVASPSSQEDLVAPVAPETPVSFSPNVSEQVPQEVVSATPVDSPPTPAEPSPPQETPAHWNTGEVAVQVHRPSKKRKRWEKESGRSCTGSGTSIGASRRSSETTRKRDENGNRPLTSRLPPWKRWSSPPVDSRPDWMQATEAITLARIGASAAPCEMERCRRGGSRPAAEVRKCCGSLSRRRAVFSEPDSR